MNPIQPPIPDEEIQLISDEEQFLNQSRSLSFRNEFQNGIYWQFTEEEKKLEEVLSLSQLITTQEEDDLHNALHLSIYEPQPYYNNQAPDLSEEKKDSIEKEEVKLSEELDLLHLTPENINEEINDQSHLLRTLSLQKDAAHLLSTDCLNNWTNKKNELDVQYNFSNRLRQLKENIEKAEIKQKRIENIQKYLKNNPPHEIITKNFLLTQDELSKAQDEIQSLAPLVEPHEKELNELYEAWQKADTKFIQINSQYQEELGNLIRRAHNKKS
ncbi:MAG: hypothetical protein JWM09_202 [Francisellaceae bacterium]|nr:hypothetical protein [Francisellaceae bacterium]